MSDDVLTVLKFCLLGLLYLFFVRVLWAVTTELRAQPSRAVPPKASRPPTTSAGTERSARPPSGRARQPTLVVTVGERTGESFEISSEVTIGRAAGCHVRIDDTFASQVHARLFEQDGTLMVDDLGSTNGTFVNEHRVTSPHPLRRGDRLRVGETELELS